MEVQTKIKIIIPIRKENKSYHNEIVEILRLVSKFCVVFYTFSMEGNVFLKKIMRIKYAEIGFLDQNSLSSNKQFILMDLHPIHLSWLLIPI